MNSERENELEKLKNSKIKMISEKIAEFKKNQKDLLDIYVVESSMPDIVVDDFDFFVKLYNSKIKAITEFENNLLNEFIYNMLFGDIVEAKINILHILNERIRILEKKINSINVEINISSNSLVSKACVKLKRKKAIVYREEINKLRSVCSDLTSINKNKESIKNIYLNYVIGIDGDKEYYTSLIKTNSNGKNNLFYFEEVDCDKETLIEYKVKTFIKIVNYCEDVNE